MTHIKTQNNIESFTEALYKHFESFLVKLFKKFAILVPLWFVAVK